MSFFSTFWVSYRSRHISTEEQPVSYCEAPDVAWSVVAWILSKERTFYTETLVENMLPFFVQCTKIL
jgi:hypothetical protein